MRTNSIEHDLSPNERLYFLHIQKTAGTTFYFTLDERFDPEEICPARFWRQFLKLAEKDSSQLRQYRLFRGHFGYSVPQFFKRPTASVTVLRDPIERSISHFRHISREPKDRRHKLVKANNMDLIAFAQHPETRLAIHNLQTRSIAFDLDLKELKQIRRFPAQGVMGTPQTNRSDDELLAIAKRRIDEFPFVGLVERFQDSLFLLSYVFGWYPIRQSRELNKAPRKKATQNISSEALELLTQLNHLDIELYNYTCHQFDQCYRSMVLDLWNRYGDSPSANAPHTVDPDTLFSWLEQHYTSRRNKQPIKPVQVLDFPFSKALSGTGWHLREGAGSGWYLPKGLTVGGTPFRWTGPETNSVIDLPLTTDTDLTIKFRIINAAAPDILESLTLRVNGHPIELETVVKQGTVAVIYGSIPKEILASEQSFTRLLFSVNRTTHESVGSSEGRLVGIAFHRLQIFPKSFDLKHKDEDFTHFLFPTDDLNWVQVADFVATHLLPNEKLVAPGEFAKRFPEQFRSQDTPFIDKPELNWVIVHRGMLQAIDCQSLKWAIAHMKPVFSNALFIVLSNRQDVPTVRRFTQDWVLLQAQVRLLELEKLHHLPSFPRIAVFQLNKVIGKVIKKWSKVSVDR